MGLASQIPFIGTPLVELDSMINPFILLPFLPSSPCINVIDLDDGVR
jgi:hypothetical protein